MPDYFGDPRKGIREYLSPAVRHNLQFVLIALSYIGGAWGLFRLFSYAEGYRLLVPAFFLIFALAALIKIPISSTLAPPFRERINLCSLVISWAFVIAMGTLPNPNPDPYEPGVPGADSLLGLGAVIVLAGMLVYFWLDDTFGRRGAKPPGW